MTPNMERGARIIIHEWVKVRVWDKVLIVTSKEYLAEAKAMEKEKSTVSEYTACREQGAPCGNLF